MHLTALRAAAGKVNARHSATCLNNLLRVPKSHFWQSAPDLPNAFGSFGKSEFARLVKKEALFTGFPKKICVSKDFSGRGGAAARRRAFCDKQNADGQRRATTSAKRENPAQSLSANVGFSFDLTEICFISFETNFAPLPKSLQKQKPRFLLLHRTALRAAAGKVNARHSIIRMPRRGKPRGQRLRVPAGFAFSSDAFVSTARNKCNERQCVNRNVNRNTAVRIAVTGLISLTLPVHSLMIV